jgi:carbamate kinase
MSNRHSSIDDIDPSVKGERKMEPLAAFAIGGNSLVTDNAHQSVPDQWKVIQETAIHLTTMIDQGWNLLVTHGNGPQLGYTALRAELAQNILHPLPLDICGAEVQGNMGYMIQQALHNEFRRRGIRREVITLVTQVLVDPNDPAFQHPTKPIGLFYSQEEARELQTKGGWMMIEDAGRGWRRVVPSPRPQAIIEIASIQTMIEAGFIVIAGGGGGIPVTRDEQGNLHGIEAAVDKDLTGSLFASTLRADLFLISTAVAKVALNYRQTDQLELDEVRASEAQRYFNEGHFAKGSMGPKVQAALEYLERGGKAALITMPQCIGRALVRESGTWILPDDDISVPAQMLKVA